MGENLTSCDLNVGHCVLNPCILIDHKEPNNTLTETALYHASESFVHLRQIKNGYCDLERRTKII